MNRALRLVAFVPVLMLLAGCPKNPPKPKPGDTAFTPGTNKVDWVDPTTIYGADAGGLSLRDSTFPNAGTDANRDDTILPDVYFDYDKAFIKPSERPKLQAAADYLKANPQDRLVVEGNCDWRGTRDYNLGLGEQRAAAAKNYLVDLGVDASRIETLSHGDLNATENASESQMSQDRRDDLVVLHGPAK